MAYKNQPQYVERVRYVYVEVPRKEERSLLDTLVRVGVVGGGLALLKMVLLGDPTDIVEVAAEVGENLFG